MSVIIGLHSPKNAANLANIKRALSCYGGGQIHVVASRIQNMDRSPRPLRDHRYEDASIQYISQFSVPLGFIPIAVEVGGSMPLKYLEHPEHAMYFFGAEDGSVPPQVLKKCHYVVQIPTVHCLNLAVAVSTVLYDRKTKE